MNQIRLEEAVDKTVWAAYECQGQVYIEFTDKTHIVLMSSDYGVSDGISDSECLTSS